MGEKAIPSRLEKMLSNTPWSRLTTCYGRATVFPEYVHKILKNEDDENPYKEILNIIEHQDTLYQATPSMVRILIELLKETKTDKSWLLAILYSVFRAAEFQLEFRKPPSKKKAKLWDDLWPEFESEEIDEELWEDFTGEKIYFWHKFSANFIIAAYDLIKSFKKAEDKETKEYAEKLITLIDRYKHTQENIK